MCNPASFIVTKGFKVFWSKRHDGHTDICKEFELSENDEARIKSVQVEITPPNGEFETPLKDWVYKTDQDLLPDWWDAKDAEKHCRAALEDWAKCRLVRAGERRDVNDGEKVTAVCGSGQVGTVCGSGQVGTVCGSGQVGYVCDFGQVGTVRDSGKVGNVCDSGQVGTVCGSGQVGTVCDSGQVGTVYDSGHVGTVRDSGQVEYVYGSGQVGTVCDSGQVGNVCDSGQVEYVCDSGQVEYVRDSGQVGTVCGSAIVSFYCNFSVALSGPFSVIIDRTKSKARRIVGTEKERIVKSK